MKHITLILAVLLALLLSGCCQHEWAPAECEAPQICTGCQQTQGKALGHDWSAATCELAETCTRCAATRDKALGHDWAPAACEEPETCARCAAVRGEALGHRYDGGWTVLENGEEMSQRCTACGACETTALDWCTYLTAQLQGRWIEESCFLGLSLDASQDYYYNNAPPTADGFDRVWMRPNGLEFTSDGRMRLLTAGSIREGSYAIETRDMEKGTVYDVVITMDDDGTACVLSFANYFYRDADGSEQRWEPDGYDHNWYMYDTPPDDNGFRYSALADFFPDINGFYKDSVEADRLGMLVVGTGMFVYTKQDLTAPVARAYSLPVGAWEPGEKANNGNNTVTFSELGAFTMTGDTNISGRYRVASYKWSPLTGGRYEYRLQLEDTSVYYGGDAYLCFGGAPEGYPQGEPYMMFYLYPQSGKTETFLQYLTPTGKYPQQPDITEDPEEMYQKLSGHWKLKEERMSDRNAGRISRDETTLDIGIDGAVNLVLQEAVSGSCDTGITEYVFYFSNQKSISRYSVTLSEDFSDTYELILTRKSDGKEELSLSLTTADGATHWLYFSRAE